MADKDDEMDDEKVREMMWMMEGGGKGRRKRMVRMMERGGNGKEEMDGEDNEEMDDEW